MLHPRYPDDLDEAGAVQVGLPVKVGEVRDEAARQLLLGFESLGQDCEFGLVQRRYGAEPLALFRWMTIPAEALIDLLETDLDGFGDPANLAIRVAPWGELMAYDLRHDIKMHSFVHSAGIDIGRFARNQSRRMLFLKRQLLESLASGSRIFVFQAGASLTGEIALRIASALRRHGPNTLLAVGLASDTHASGTVALMGEGLLRGHIDRPGKTAAPGGGHRWNINFNAWVALCRRAAELAAPEPVAPELVARVRGQ